MIKLIVLIFNRCLILLQSFYLFIGHQRNPLKFYDAISKHKCYHGSKKLAVIELSQKLMSKLRSIIPHLVTSGLC